LNIQLKSAFVKFFRRPEDKKSFQTRKLFKR
jgi:hypothetical protein